MKLPLNRRAFVKSSFLASLYALLGPVGCDSENPEGETKQRGSVIIIGAGVAGLAAAKHLLRRGFEVTVLEGRDRVGGRLWTNTSWGTPVEMGAMWVHGDSDNPITAWAVDLDLPFVVTDYSKFQMHYDDSEGNVVKLTTNEVGAVNARYAQFESQLLSATAGAFDQDNLSDRVTSIVEGMNLTADEITQMNWKIFSEIGLDVGAEFDEISLKYWNSGKEFSGSDIVFSKGYKKLIDLIADELDIRLNTAVQKVTYDETSVTVATTQGEFTADRVLVTVPQSVLKQGDVTFDPKLPDDKIAAISNLSTGVVEKMAMEFSNVFWTPDREYFGYAKNNSDSLMEFWSMLPYTGENVLVAMVYGDYASRLSKLSDTEVKTAMLSQLTAMFGDDVEQPLEFIRSNWSDDPFSRGAYSYIGPEANPHQYEVMAQSVGNTLFFAGEATHIEYPGTVHGAFLSGIREAEKIVSFHTIENL